MPAQTAQPQQVSKFQAADTDSKKMRQVVKGIEYKAQHNGSRVEGYVATKGVDRAGDYFTEEALQEMAQQIQDEIQRNNANVKVVFPEFSEEDLKQIKQNYTSNGNVDHYNNPGYPMGDPRIVSAYKIVDAEYDGFGVKVKAELNEDLPFGVPEAIKAGLQEGYLDGFSVEFIAKRARNVMKDGQKVREILSSKFTGASLTGRPIQSSASVTDAEFKSMVGDVESKIEYGYSVGDTVRWNTAGGTTSGTVRDRSKDSCFNSEIDGDVEVCGTEEEPAYLIEVDNEDETMVAHKQGSLSASQESKAEIPDELEEELGEDRFIPPETAADNARKALRWKEEKDAPGGEQQGTDTARQIIDAVEESEPLSKDMISEIASFDRHREQGNHEIDEENEGSPWEDAGYVAWLLWGGSVGVDWAQKLNDRINEIESKAQHYEEKNMHGDEMEEKATVAGVSFQGTKDGSLDESEIPSEGFEDHYLVDGDNKTESSYPVVDADGFLRRGNVEDAWNLRGQAEDISKGELESMLEKLNEEFDSPPISDENIQESKSFINRVEELEDERSAWQELKNYITGDTMPDEQEEQDPEPEEEQDQEDVEEQESKSAAEELRDELSEVRQEIKSVVEENKQLQEEKEEMEQKFDNLDEDLDGIQEVKSEIDELKQELKNVTPENAPQQDTDETRDQQVSEQESKSDLERQLGAYSNPRRVIDNQDMKAAIADRHGVTPDEVEEKAQELAE